MNQTSEQVYQEYQRLKLMEEKLKKDNAGLNLLNAEKFKPSYFISVHKVEKVNIVGKEEEIVVETNLPFMSWRYNSDKDGIKEFFNQLEGFVKVPRYKLFVEHNRKGVNKLGWYGFPKFREETLVFNEIKIGIGDRARADIEKQGFDFVERLKFYLAQQKEPSEKEQKDFERYNTLVYQIHDLKRQHEEKGNYYYGQDVDKTFKIRQDDVSFNEKMKATEDELKKICKKYAFLKMPDIRYAKIKEPVMSFEDWREKHEEEIKGIWDSDVDKDDYGDNFDTYLEDCYNQFCDDGNEDYGYGDDE